jgi:hypothetical protein
LSVDRPVFHFTTVTAGKYEIKGEKSKEPRIIKPGLKKKLFLLVFNQRMGQSGNRILLYNHQQAT